jgi:hypothetical protein
VEASALSSKESVSNYGQRSSKEITGEPIRHHEKLGVLPVLFTAGESKDWPHFLVSSEPLLQRKDWHSNSQPWIILTTRKTFDNI